MDNTLKHFLLKMPNMRVLAWVKNESAVPPCARCLVEFCINDFVGEPENYVEKAVADFMDKLGFVEI